MWGGWYAQGTVFLQKRVLWQNRAQWMYAAESRKRRQRCSCSYCVWIRIPSRLPQPVGYTMYLSLLGVIGGNPIFSYFSSMCLLFKNKFSRAVEMAQQIKQLLHKWEVWSLNPESPHKCQVGVVDCLRWFQLRKAGTGHPWSKLAFDSNHIDKLWVWLRAPLQGWKKDWGGSRISPLGFHTHTHMLRNSEMYKRQKTEW